MNRNKLKTYAPQARRDFIQAVTDRAALYGLTAKKIEPTTEKGDVVLIAGQPFPKAVGEKRNRLEARIGRIGFQQTMEAMAYTWFNRFVAIRFMELHGYLEHGYRVLSHPEGHTQPELLEHAEHVDLTGLDKQKVIAFKLDGTKEEELYRHVLLGQCNALSKAMPFLFERIDDESELLLPDNLLHSDSLIRKLVNEIDEEDWQQVEIIGWLYQFYISERKDEVIGKVVASEDIPAATQLFTPNWIVKYLVQNTLGRQWLATYPQSALRQQMQYFIEPAEQTPEVQEQLKAITPLTLNPEELTLLDPACGSGHILVEAYDLFKAIYQERGYRAKDIPALILQKNLFGLEIDDRAAQLAAFALMMKARADDRRIFESEAKPNILAFEDSQGMKASDIHFALTSPLKGEKEGELESPAPDGHLFESDDNLFTRAEDAKAAASRTPTTVNFSQADIATLLELFEHAKTFGSLIQIPPKLAAKLPEIEKRLDDVLNCGDLTHASVRVLKPLLRQARLLSRQYGSVVANPPYMGSKYYTPELKAFVWRSFKDSKADLYSCFIHRSAAAVKRHCLVGMITIPNWMFLSSFESFRQQFLSCNIIDTLVHNGRGVFGSDFGSSAFVFRNAIIPEYRAVYRRLFDKQGSVSSVEELEARFHSAKNYTPSSSDFRNITGSPIAYWASKEVFRVFGDSPSLAQIANPRAGMATSDNLRFVRLWHEVSIDKVGFLHSTIDSAHSSGSKWFPYNKGGPYRRWYGNNYYLLSFDLPAYALLKTLGNHCPSEAYYFRTAITWTDISASLFGVRHSDQGFVFDASGSSAFPSEENHFAVLGFLASSVASHLLAMINPTVHFQPGNLAALPWIGDQGDVSSKASEIVKELVSYSRLDWDSFEVSWDFARLPVVEVKRELVSQSQDRVDETYDCRFSRLKVLEEQNNRLFIDAFALNAELSSRVLDEQITLYRPNRTEDIRRLLSYAIGCMIGRYSLDKPGLIYAHSGNQGFDFGQYKTFRADDDGILPLFETDWGIQDDATSRFVEFISVAWPKEHLEENLKFVADSLGPTNGEQPRDTIRRYLATGFYKHHLSMYKKRPIYWLFSSGKQRAFQCLVYLHRYNEGTLAVR